MNILFVTMFQISEQKGGTERTTARISNELRCRGHRCFNLYAKPIGDMFEMTKFDDIYKDCSANAIKNIIETQRIDKIIIEGAFILVKNVSEGRSKASCKPKMFFVHHFAPGYEPYFNAFSSIWKQMLYAQSTANRMKSLVKVLIYPFSSLTWTLLSISYTKLLTRCVIKLYSYHPNMQMVSVSLVT